MTDYIIESCKIKDLKALQDISKESFIETFERFNTPDNLNTYINQAYSLEKLTAELNTPDSYFHFIKNEKQHVGYLKINFYGSQSDFNFNDYMEIERIYVLNVFKNKGLGKKLMDFAFNQAIKKNICKVWLGVWENNLAALSFYEKMGFTKKGQHPFVLGNDIQNDYILEKIL